MVSIWWVIAAFVLGGYAGLFVFALLNTAGKESERASEEESQLEREGLAPMHLEARWGSK